MRKTDPYPILEARIRSGAYQHGTWLAPERELADELGVHRHAIRRAVARLADAGLLERRVGHRPIVRGPAGEALALRSAALLMGNEPLFHGFQPVLRGCGQEFRTAGYGLIYVDTRGHAGQSAREVERRAIENLLEQPVAGVIIWCQDPANSAPLLEKLKDAGTPIVAIDRLVNGVETDFVGVENFSATEVAVRHLWELGHQRIGMVTLSEESSPVQEREAGFRAALERLCLPCDERFIFRLPEGPEEDAAYVAEVVESLRTMRERPTALLTINDIIAWRLVQHLGAAGLRVPEDVAVVGFDDLEANTMHRPVLTTIRQPHEGFGRHAARLLLRRLNSPIAPFRHVLLDTSLIIRATTVAGARPDPQRPAGAWTGIDLPFQMRAKLL
ncbi:MAG TPA: GntR family transcriptional regulator [Armatimonadota bacterium]